MSKVIMVKCSFYGCLSEPQGVSAWWKETAQTRVFVLPPSLLLNHFSRLLTHNATRHCRVHFYAFVGQPLSKQLYMKKICPSYVGVHSLAQKFHFLCQLKICRSVRCKVTLPLMRLIITCTVPKETNNSMILQQVDWIVTQVTLL